MSHFARVGIFSSAWPMLTFDDWPLVDNYGLPVLNMKNKSVN